MAEQRCAVGQVFCFEKQFAKSRMREIIGGGSEDDLRVTGDVDLSDPRALIDHRHPTDFDIDTEPERLARIGDLWADILASKQDLKALIEAS